MSRCFNRKTMFRSDEDQHVVTRLLPSQFSENVIQIPIGHEIRNISFAKRPYFYPIYDMKLRRILLKSGRQVGKTAFELCEITRENGSVAPLKDIQVGDRIAGLAGAAHTGVGVVNWKSPRYYKPCIRIRTRQGHTVIVARTHPMRTWGSWTAAGELTVGSRLAVVRRAGEFSGTARVGRDWLLLTAGMIAEGSCYGTPHFTQDEGPLLDDVRAACARLSIPYREHCNNGNDYSRALLFVEPERGQESPVTVHLRAWGLFDERSADKHLPSWVWDLSREDAAFFLNRLWAGDGSCELHGNSYQLTYSSISRRLVRDVQRLLWKFGIPTTLTTRTPEVYEGTEKRAYELRIETADGARRFLTEIGALGKSEKLALPEDGTDNSNRDTYPLEIAEDIQRVHRSRSGWRRRGRVPQPSLSSVGLREKPKYPLSRRKLSAYVSFFAENLQAGFDVAQVTALALHQTTDLFWDEVESIEDVGEQPCYDISVDGTESFIADGFITHNSTWLANALWARAALVPHTKILYVAPTIPQATQFSNDRLRTALEFSELLGAMRDEQHVSQILHKALVNGSEIRLLYAYLDAERARGQMCHVLCLDECQSLPADAVPVLQKTLFTAGTASVEYQQAATDWGGEGPLELWCGTPLSPANLISSTWRQQSTQCEWLIPCNHCGSVRAKTGAGRTYNEPGPKNVGKNGLICSRCGGDIVAYDPGAFWAPANPEPRDAKGSLIIDPFDGFHIPQILHPLGDQWQSQILGPMQRDPEYSVLNEIFGLDADVGFQPITRDQILSMCLRELTMRDGPLPPGCTMGPAYFENAARTMGSTLGVDWDSGTENAFTVVTLGLYPTNGQRLTFPLVERLTGHLSDPKAQVRYILGLVERYNVQMIGCDFGGGYTRNRMLQNALGGRSVLVMQYGGHKLCAWDKDEDHYMVYRNKAMRDVFQAMVEQKFWFPRREEFETPYADDILNIFGEYNERKAMVQYDHPVGMPDDTFHSILYCLMANCAIGHYRDDIWTAPLEFQNAA